MRYYESKKGYFYKQYKNGKKVRISRKNFIKKQIGKKQIGKGRSISNFTINGRKIILVSVSHDEALDKGEIDKLFNVFNDFFLDTYFLLEEDTRFNPTQLLEHYYATDNNRMTDKTSRAIIGKMIQTYSSNDPKLERVKGWDVRPTLYNTKIRDWLYGNSRDEFTEQIEGNYMRDTFNKMDEVIKLSIDQGNGNDYSDFYKLNDLLYRVFNPNDLNHYDLRNWEFTRLQKLPNLINKRIYNLIIETAKSLQEFYKNKADQYVLNKFIYNLSDTKNYIIIVGEKHYENLIKQIQIKQKQLESDNLMSIMPYDFYNTEMDYNNNTEMDYKNNTEMDYKNNTEMDYNNEN